MQVIELSYSWREQKPDFNLSDKEAIATAINQLISQIAQLPPSSYEVRPVELVYEGTVDLPDSDAGSPDQLYKLTTSYAVQ